MNPESGSIAGAGVVSLGLATAAILALVWIGDLIRRALVLRQVRDSQPVELTFSWMHGKKVINLDILSEVPISLIVAVILQEDVDFFRHWGFQLREMLRSAVISIWSRKLKGGSSISQQVVKRLCFNRSERRLNIGSLGSWYRKLCEIPLTLYAEHLFSKKEILSIYLDSANFGSCAIGVRDGAAVVCRKPLARLNLGEILLLCFILIRPRRGNLQQLVEEMAGSERARCIYERALVIQRTCEGLGSSPLENLPLNSPYYIENLSDKCREHERIEVATEAVHQFHEAAQLYLTPAASRVPVHATFFSPEQRTAMSLAFGARQNLAAPENGEARSSIKEAQDLLNCLGLTEEVALAGHGALAELGTIASEYLVKGLGNWTELQRVVELVNWIPCESLPQQDPLSEVPKNPDPILILMGLCTQFTRDALPRDRYILPAQSACSRRFVAISYSGLFKELGLVSQRPRKGVLPAQG